MSVVPSPAPAEVPVQVEIWSDIVCPWCAVGKARFDAALADFPHRDRVQVRYRSFELDPDAPRSRPGRYVDHLAARYGTSVEQAQEMIDRVTETAAAEGLAMRFDTAQAANTFDAHRLLHLAADRDRQAELTTRLFAAHFAEGHAIDDPATLRALAVEVGLDDAEVAEVLDGDRYADAVRADEQQATAFGIGGVPFFVLERTYAVSGAQPVEVMRSALDQGWQAANALPLVPASGASTGCADGTCHP